MKAPNSRQLSDDEILSRYRHDKDNEWIGILFERYLHLLFGICMKYFKNEEDARDAVQQIFIKVMNELPRFNVQYFKGWLYQVAKNYCLMELRRPEQKKKELNENIIPGEVQEDMQQPVLKDRQLQQMEKALEQLNEEQKTCISLFYLQKKSYQEVAQITGYSMLQVKSYIQNGKRNMRLIMEKNREHE